MRSGDEVTGECSICLDNFKNGQVRINATQCLLETFCSHSVRVFIFFLNLQQILAEFATGCKHSFHQTCVVEWFLTGDTRCPLCRFDPITGTW